MEYDLFGGIFLELKSKAIAVFACALGVMLLIGMLRSGHFFKAAALTVVSGFAALFAVNLLAAFTGVSLAVNPVTLGVSGISGIPGVVMLLAVKLMLR